MFLALFSSVTFISRLCDICATKVFYHLCMIGILSWFTVLIERLGFPMGTIGNDYFVKCVYHMIYRRVSCDKED